MTPPFRRVHPRLPAKATESGDGRVLLRVRGRQVDAAARDGEDHGAAAAIRRRAVLVTAVTLAAVGLEAAGLWWIGIPRYRPPPRAGERYGIDVSHHQGAISWDALGADDIEFASIKATEGRDHTDPRFAENWAAAGAVGLDRGAYHFFTPCSTGAAQGEHFVAVAPPDPSALTPAVDLELVGNCSARPPEEAFARELDAFLRVVEAAWGRAALLYVGSDLEEVHPVRSHLGRPLWTRRFLRRPADPWAVWQVQGWARIDGIRGGAA